MEEKDTKQFPEVKGSFFTGSAVPLLKDLFGFVNNSFKHYGAMFKATAFGIDFYIISGNKAASEFCKEENISRKGLTHPKLVEVLTGGEKKTLPYLSGEIHRERKQLFYSLFSEEAINSYLPYVFEEIDLGLSQLAKKKKLCIFNDFRTLVVPIIFRTLFGFDTKYVHSNMKKLDALCYDTVNGLNVHLPFKIKGNDLSKGVDAAYEVKKMAIEHIQKFEKMLDEGKQLPFCIVANLVKQLRSVDKKNHPLEEIAGDVVHVFAASNGFTTVWTIYMLQLYRHPHVIHRMKEELKNKFKFDKDGNLTECPKFEQLESLEYSKMVHKELLRANPILPVNFGSAVKDLDIDGYHIPKGAEVLFGLHITNQDSAVYKNPEKLDPDRFSPGRKEDEKAPFPMGAFATHGVGPADTTSHRCVGEVWIRVVTCLFFAKLIPKYQWKILGEQNLELNTGLLTPIPFDGVLGIFGTDLSKEKDDQKVKYQVTFTTGDEAFAATGSHVYVTLKGSKGTTKEEKINSSSHNFNRRQVDVFMLHHVGDIGELECVQIRKDTKGIGSNWFLESVSIRKVTKWLDTADTEKKWEIQFNKWIKEEKVELKV